MTLARLNTLDAAGLCADFQLHVIPVWRAVPDKGCTCPRGLQCISPGKHPAIDSWQTAASTDHTVLRDWFSDDRYNIGVVCGPSNVCVVDVDPRNGGHDTFAALVNELGPLPHTVTADSGGGGVHYVFRRPTGDLESKLGAGVDLLRDSRQFLVEPSVHPSGQSYRWRVDCAPDECTIAQLPEAWLKRVRKQPVRRLTTTIPAISTDARLERARKYIAKMPAAIQGDHGHDALFNVVCTAMVGFDLDEGATRSIVDEYNLRCDPSFSEKEIAHKIKQAATKSTRDRGYLLQPNRTPVTSTRQAAASVESPSKPAERDWLNELIAKKDGSPKRSYHNAEIFVRMHPEYAGRWTHNRMTDEPWFDGEPMRESTLHVVRAHAERVLGYTPPVADIKAAVLVASEERSFHPVQQYLDSIDWDGATRLPYVAREHLGASSELHGEMVRRWMIGAVARALSPGCKLDTALMLHGAQGLGKSTFFATLGAPWHSDSTIDVGNKDAYQQIHAAWLYEFSELENVVSGRAESRMKAFITSTNDMFRAPYKATVTPHPRSVALCGTTNRREILTDDTGSRRFWIVPVTQEIDRVELAYARDQLWAEARAAYEAGSPWWFDRQLDAEREIANREYDTDDSWEEPIRGWLARPVTKEVTVSEVLEQAIKLDVAKQDRVAQMRVVRVLKKLGWLRARTGPRADRSWAYRRPGQASMEVG
jgi:hypothetical protein